MPIVVHADVRRIDQKEFARIAYDVMEHAFSVHNDMGRFFDEHIYRDAIATRVDASQTEVRIEVRFDDFHREYFIDLLVERAAVFELKAVSALGGSQRAQLLNYLLLTGLSHGKLVNFRKELVEHEFVNTHLRLADRTAFRVVDRDWEDPGPAERPLRAWLVALLRDVGVGLDVRLYESAVSHLFGGEEAVSREIDILDNGRSVGRQRVRLTTPNRAFNVSTLDESGIERFEQQLRRFLRHTTLDALDWINITRDCATFTTLKNG